ncbi:MULTISPECIES: hypothetical protein [Aeromonas]|nr:MULTISPECIES: hypothetical protein [Aeromonas]MBL0501314.1 hypothetical protein [Aeromonas caviae]MBL0558258.1 hypothetical protein [Aeromonas caviae]MBP4067208.1 hypothetical protein [Aeromonas sp. MaB10011B]MBP4080225.1 hypothetical protein [Aeromonas sp. MrichA-1]MDH1847132.1 hypothetical protein [Aeromonas caviae]
MSITMDEEIKRWTAKRKSALVMEIIQGISMAREGRRMNGCHRAALHHT